MTEIVRYFAFGSNLDVAQMEHRCPGHRILGPAVLEGHRLVFGGVSPRWEHLGVASILPDPERRVPGVVYELHQVHIDALDHFEGHPIRYQRKTVEVLHGDALVDAVIYAKKETLEPRGPSAAYFETMARAYARLGFDRKLLEEARVWARGSGH